MFSLLTIGSIVKHKTNSLHLSEFKSEKKHKISQFISPYSLFAFSFDIIMATYRSPILGRYTSHNRNSVDYIGDNFSYKISKLKEQHADSSLSFHPILTALPSGSSKHNINKSSSKAVRSKECSNGEYEPGTKTLETHDNANTNSNNFPSKIIPRILASQRDSPTNYLARSCSYVSNNVEASTNVITNTLNETVNEIQSNLAYVTDAAFSMVVDSIGDSVDSIGDSSNCILEYFEKVLFDDEDFLENACSKPITITFDDSTQNNADIRSEMQKLIINYIQRNSKTPTISSLHPEVVADDMFDFSSDEIYDVEDDMIHIERMTSFDTQETSSTIGSYSTTDNTNQTFSTGIASDMTDEAISSWVENSPSQRLEFDDDGYKISRDVLKAHQSRRAVIQTLQLASSNEENDRDVLKPNLKRVTKKFDKKLNKMMNNNDRRIKVVTFQYPPVSSMRTCPKIAEDEKQNLFFTEEELHDYAQDRRNVVSDDVEIVDSNYESTICTTISGDVSRNKYDRNQNSRLMPDSCTGRKGCHWSIAKLINPALQKSAQSNIFPGEKNLSQRQHQKTPRFNIFSSKKRISGKNMDYSYSNTKKSFHIEDYNITDIDDISSNGAGKFACVAHSNGNILTRNSTNGELHIEGSPLSKNSIEYFQMDG